MFLVFVQWWVLLSAGLSAAGWLLSFVRHLSPAGYLLFCAAFAFILFLARSCVDRPAVRWTTEIGKLRKRFGKAAPFLFLSMSLLSMAGGLLYDPVHGDSQSYRVPRVLHWLWEHQWHWIHTGDVRTNVVTPGLEWIWAPGFYVLPGERWLFLYNIISLLLLPGLLFALFREVGVRPRIAWWWMWILPAAYSYALQAGGISTDAYATVYALAAVVFALRARRNGSRRELLFSIVAASLMTGAKQTNLLLLPLWCVPFLLNGRLLVKTPAALVLGTALLAIAASCLPTSYLNTKYAGNWQGFTDTRTFVPHSKLYGILGNALALPAQNLLPPVFPLADRWNRAMHSFRATPLGARFEGFEDFGHLYRMPSDTTGGLGLVLSVLAAWAFLSRTRVDRRPLNGTDRLLRMTFTLGPWLLLVVFMAKVGTATNARYLAPLYPFLIAPILLRARAQYRFRAWRIAAYLSLIVTIFLLISSRQRPLFPVQTICALAEKKFPQTDAIQKVRNAYGYFQEHAQLMNTLAAAIPRTEKVAGYATEVGFLESVLWLPFGSRRVERLTGAESPEFLREKGVTYMVLEEAAFEAARVTSPPEWLERYQAEQVATYPLRRLGPEARVETVYLMRLK